MGPHIRPSHQTINIPVETPTSINSDMRAQAQAALNHSFGSVVSNPPANPFAGMTVAPSTQGSVSTPNSRLGTGIGSGLHAQDRIMTSAPLPTTHFRSTAPRRDPALAGANLGHREGIHAPAFQRQSPASALHHATSGQRQTATRPQAAQPGLNIRYAGTSADYTPQAQGGRTHTTVTDNYRARSRQVETHLPAHASGRPHAPATREERIRDLVTRAQERISGGRIDLGLRTSSSIQRARNEFAAANQMLQQAERLSRGHRMSPETMASLREVNARLDSSLLDLPENRTLA